jgi:hypothetical protein
MGMHWFNGGGNAVVVAGMQVAGMQVVGMQ